MTQGLCICGHPRADHRDATGYRECLRGGPSTQGYACGCPGYREITEQDTAALVLMHKGLVALIEEYERYQKGAGPLTTRLRGLLPTRTLGSKTPRPSVHVARPSICDGCNVREPFEHRCHGEPCGCAECREADRLFG